MCFLSLQDFLSLTILSHTMGNENLFVKINVLEIQYNFSQSSATNQGIKFWARQTFNHSTTLPSTFLICKIAQLTRLSLRSFSILTFSTGYYWGLMSTSSPEWPLKKLVNKLIQLIFQIHLNSSSFI